MSSEYDDIIHLPRHASANRPQMSIENRAAQLSPFAALTGHDVAVKETARLTDEKTELSEGMIAELDMKLGILIDGIAEQPEVLVTYFVPDGKKTGGAYVEARGTMKRIDEYDRVLVLQNGQKIPISDIIDIRSELFATIMQW